MAGGSRGSSWVPLWLTLGLVGLLWLALPSVILVVVGMLPSLAAIIVDRSKQRYLTFSVGAMNFCGLFPQLLKLWTGMNTVDSAVALLTDVFSLFTMYGAAALGWLIFLGVPPVVSAFMSVMAQRRITMRRELQQELVERWGEEVAGTGDHVIEYD